MQTKLGLILVAAAVASSAAIAEPESASERLTKLEAETLLLKARERQLEVQANILTKQNEILLKQAAADQLTQSTVTGDPVIRSIESIGNATFVTLQLSNGHLIDAKVGDVLSNGMRIISIKPNEVVVVQRGRQKRLTAASEALPNFNPNYPAVGMNLPPPLPLAPARVPAR